jgi:hypothetical protein
MANPVSRREFFGQMSASAAVAVAPIAAPPPRAWIIVALNWEYNDEFSYQEGEFARTELFYDQETAEAECQRLCSQFFTEVYPSPADFEPDWNWYDIGFGADFDETAVTWDQLRAVGFPDPYFIQELTVPGAESL